MQIQNSNMRYTGSYSILNANRGSSFPYTMKVDGIGALGNRKSLFSFGKVTITEHMVTAKYGTKITNGSRVHMRTSGSKKQEDLYDPNGAGTLAKLREEQVKHGGIV